MNKTENYYRTLKLSSTSPNQFTQELYDLYFEEGATQFNTTLNGWKIRSPYAPAYDNLTYAKQMAFRDGMDFAAMKYTEEKYKLTELAAKIRELINGAGLSLYDCDEYPVYSCIRTPENNFYDFNFKV